LLSTLTIDTVIVNFKDEYRPSPPSEDIWYTYANFLRWTALRGARIADLAISWAFLTDAQLRSGVLSTSGATIQTIDFVSGVIDYTLPSEVINKYCATIAEVGDACKRTSSLWVRGVWALDSYLSSIVQAFPRVQYFKLDSTTFTAKGLQVFRNLTAIQWLTVSGCSVALPPDLAVPTLEFLDGFGGNVTDDLAVALGRNCPQLHTLYCGKRGNSITDVGARALLLGCPLLRNCSVQHLGGVSDMLRVELARRCEWHKLCFAEWVGFSDSLGRSLLTLKPALVLLDASSCTQLTDQTLGVAARHCRLLEDLNVEFADHITLAGIKPFIFAGNKLKALSVSTADDALMQLIGEHCKELRTLNVFYCGIIEGRRTDVGVRAVLQGCPLLQQTDVEYANGISLELRVELVRRGTCVSLLLNCWFELSEELLIGILAVWPHLENLKCFNREALTDAALATCAQHCPQLKTLSIRRCPAVTSRGLIEFFRPRNKLTSIDLAGMHCVDDAVAEAILQHCSCVHQLFMPAGLSREMTDRLRQGYRYVRFALAPGIHIL
jgi:hypothetical protein